MQIIRNENKIMFGPVRLSHVHIIEPHAFQGEEDRAKYSCVPIIPKSEKDLLKELRAAIDNAYERGVREKWGGRKPPFENYPVLVDGDGINKNGEERGSEAKGCYIINAKSKNRPGVVNRDKMPITNADDVYSGMWGCVSLTFYAYDSNGSKGVACALNNVMKTRDDERFGGGASAQSDFADFNLEEVSDQDL